MVIESEDWNHISQYHSKYNLLTEGNLIWSHSGSTHDNLDYLSGIVDYKILIDSSLVTLWQKKRR